MYDVRWRFYFHFHCVADGKYVCKPSSFYKYPVCRNYARIEVRAFGIHVWLFFMHENTVLLESFKKSLVFILMRNKQIYRMHIMLGHSPDYTNENLTSIHGCCGFHVETFSGSSRCSLLPDPIQWLVRTERFRLLICISKTIANHCISFGVHLAATPLPWLKQHFWTINCLQ